MPSKLDLALSMVSMAVNAGVRASTVVGDSAFSSMWWLREVMALGRYWLVALRKDRRLRIGAEVQRFDEWCRTMPLELVEMRGNRGSIWGGIMPEAILLDRGCNKRGLACRPAYYERRDRRGKVVHRWYLATNQLGWDIMEIWQGWGKRWAIEVFHRDSKQHMRLNQFHVRNWEGIVALVVCTSLRASLLWAIKVMEPNYRELSIEGLTTTLREAACIVNEENHGLPTINVPPRLRKAALWSRSDLPLPVSHWPIRLRVA